MLSLYLQRARIPLDAHGLRILDLGCGWGSFSIFAAQKLPNCSFLMISNSAPQKIHIEARAANLGLRNITVKTRNVATMEIDDEDRGAFDRIVSVEMMEHMKNYELLLQKVSQFLKPDGLLFIHIFTHARASYHFETEGAHNWMGRHFFTGGTQPLLPPLVLQPSIFSSKSLPLPLIVFISPIYPLRRHHAQPLAA
jgi:cyclopropane-fatty-acyl-phospholipid synthase